MSLSCSDTESSSDSFNGDISDLEEEFEERQVVALSSTADSQLDDVDEGAYQDEPIASDQWMEQYNQRQKEISELESELKKRLTGELPVSDWCKCGNCGIRNLQNLSECYCCTELEGCVESLTTDLVRQELSSEVELSCVTQHPGFPPVCLNNWSLRMAADRFKTKNKQRYRKTGSEERFLRSIAYREFSRLIYDMLGSRRIRLPACAYLAIRDAFPVSTSEETYTGFDLDEES